MTTQTKTIVWRQEGATRTDEEERLEGELLSCSLDSRVKEPPGGAFQCPAAKAPLRESARRYIRRRRSVSGMWRRRVCGEVLDTTISRVSRVPRVSVDRRGFHIFPRRVGPGTRYPYVDVFKNHFSITILRSSTNTMTRLEGENVGIMILFNNIHMGDTYVPTVF